MAEYIKREDVERNLFKIPVKVDEDGYSWILLRDAFHASMDAPTADVAPVRHGKWILEYEPNGKPYCFHCSVCDGDFHYIGITTKYDFCPNCGAKMEVDNG